MLRKTLAALRPRRSKPKKERSPSCSKKAAVASSPVAPLEKEPKQTENERSGRTDNKQLLWKESSSEAAIVSCDNDPDLVDGEVDTLTDAELQALLDRKIEQAPAAKVIVSEAMMKEAMNEIKSRNSSLLHSKISKATTDRSSGSKNALATPALSGNRRLVFTATNSSNATRVTTANGLHIGGGDASGPLSQNLEGNSGGHHDNGGINDDDDGFNSDEELGFCPLDKICEFLQAIMTKKYKRALDLAKEVEKYEPNNALIMEYQNVLQKLLSKDENESSNNFVDSSDDEGMSVEDEDSEELSSSSETDSISEDGSNEEDESSTSSEEETTSGSEDEDDEDSESSDDSGESCGDEESIQSNVSDSGVHATDIEGMETSGANTDELDRAKLELSGDCTEELPSKADDMADAKDQDTNFAALPESDTTL